MHNEVGDEITYSFPNFGGAVEFWEFINYFIHI